MMKPRFTWRVAMLMVLPFVLLVEPNEWRAPTIWTCAGLMVLDALVAWVTFLWPRTPAPIRPPVSSPSGEQSASQIPLPPSVKEHAKEVRKRLRTDRLID